MIFAEKFCGKLDYDKHMGYLWKQFQEKWKKFRKNVKSVTIWRKRFKKVTL